MCSLASALGEIESVYVTVARNGKRETSRWRNKDPGKHGDRGCRGREKRERERDMGEKGGKRVRRREKGTSAKFLPNWGGTTTSTTTTTTTAANLG